MLRHYPGLFSEYIQIDEYWIARSLQVEPAVIFKILQKLHQQSIVDYVPTRTTPYFTLVENRVHPKELSISQENYDFLKQTYKEKIDAVINYVKTEDKCRSRLLLEYFGEFDSNDCGRCDVCYNISSHHALINEIAAKILKIIHTHQLTINELAMKMEYDIELVREAVKLLLDGDRATLTPQRKLQIKTK
jgi:ATP-dependent DNA helicase RecQ